MKAIITAIITLIFPSRLAIFLLNLLGHQIDKSAKIGCSFLQCQHIEMAAGSQIGHFNLIRIPHVKMGESASIRSMNRLKGPFDLLMDKKTAIGNSNSIYRASFPIAIGYSKLQLDELAIITSKHTLDCTCSIEIGAFTTISGFSTQFWTHGFYHENEGAGRIRIDGPIIIGKNVSIGSRCVINPGIRVGDAINVGGNSCISKSIHKPGMYVSQALRYVPMDIEAIKTKLKPNPLYQIVEVYEKSVA